MDNYVCPEAYEQAQLVIKKALGGNADVASVEWSAGGLFNKVYYVNTNLGGYVLKIECNDVFISTRKDQMENEIYGSKLFNEAGIPCPEILGYDLGKKDIGARYVLQNRISNDILWCDWFSYTPEQKEKICFEVKEIFEKMNGITSDYFGSLSPNGLIGRHKTWDDCYSTILRLLISDCERLSLLTADELNAVKKTCAYLAGKSPDTYIPTLCHNDFGRHNTIWGSTNGAPEAVHVIDFGNAIFGLPYMDEFIVYKSGDFDFAPCDILNERNVKHEAYDKWLFIGEFEKMLWTASEKLTNDYAHCTDGLTQSIESSKADNSRSYILEFVNKCYGILCNKVK